MEFEDVLNNGKLWAVVYDGDTRDILTKTFIEWMDPVLLRTFFEHNQDDLSSYYHITNLDQAILDTIADAASLSNQLMDVRSGVELNCLFRPLENSRIHEMLLSREKAKGKRISGHSSWLRVYAIKLDNDIYLATGGAIKLTKQMQDRPHTRNELLKLERVRNCLLDLGIVDAGGVLDYNETKI
jgi:hypothetical protein